MRKLKLQVQITIDGFISGPNGEMDWMKFPWTEDILSYVREITEPVDTIVLGRKLAEGFIPHWANVAKDPSNPEYEGGVKYASTQKIVFTKTLGESIWENTGIAKGDLVEEINSLKSKSGKDIIPYGGGAFVSALIKNKLIDELHLFVNPAAIGKGMPIFKELTEMQKFRVIDVRNFECGIVTLVYKPI
ncbi:dihydrofolate reductase family protein [Algoriphagus halophytocola]|uniref:dihydrofolate reductase family protein n=1 Tax=Algoriphagus halophytocola TaxID=2991499 RepID=UPI0022DE7A0A|nr:dihydrofolate reductase family protein [Algoriphagus sp. TR-M9]WBL44232.1 dihydrofolate reductase family protein [Algoriphagus sp. TR-M9]